MANAKDAITTGIEQFKTGFRQGDANLVASLYSENARLLPPDSEMLTGRDAIKDFWQGAMDMGIKEATLETVEIEDGQNIACEIGKYTLTIENEGERAESSGKYVVVWKQEGDDWKMHVDIWNANPIE